LCASSSWLIDRTGPIVARSFIENTPNADFAIQNAGGCREDILAGEFTFGDAFSILPFSNTLVTMRMTGDQIRRVLEDAYNFFLDPEIGGGSGSYPIASGLRWEVNYTMPFGDRLSKLEMNADHEPGAWTALDLENFYTIVTNSFVAGVRDGYYTFGEIDKSDPEQFTDTYIEYAQSLVNYAKAKGLIVELPTEFISTQLLVDKNGTVFDLNADSDGDEELDPLTCAVAEDNDDEWCSRYINRLPANESCECYNFCNGVLVGCYGYGEAQEEYDCSAFPRLGCTEKQGTPGTAPSAAFGRPGLVCAVLVSLALSVFSL
jgi:hypothetical protein